MIPLLIGVAAVGLAGLALSGDDKKISTTTTRREIPPSEVPPDVREKFDTPSDPQSKRNIVLTAPAEGDLVEIGDKDFSQGKCRGATIKNNYSGRIISPFNGRVLEILDNGLVIESNDGIELDIRFGSGFCYVHESEQIKNHQILAAINLQVDSTIAFIVKNDKNFGDITFEANGQTITLPAKNNSTGDDKMNGSKFTILGESLSGKTCYLLAMYCEMNQGVNGYSIVAQDDNLDTELLEAFERLDDESISQERFPGATDNVQTYLFNLNYAHKPILPFEWIDYPGGVLRHKDEHYDKISKTIKESSTLFICVDGKLLVGNDTARKIRNVKRKCSMTINRYFGKYFEAGGKLPPVGIILTKTDLFRHDTNDEEIREILQEAFSPLFFSRDTQVGVIPVTLGENIQDDNYCGEVDPVNIHLPIFMGIWFALNDQIQIFKYLIESNKGSINDWRSLKHDEEDSFFIWRDDEKIRRLAAQISRTQKENERIQQLVENMKRDREMFQSYLN